MNELLKEEIKKLIKEELEKFKQELNITNRVTNPEIENLNKYFNYELNNQTQYLENTYSERFKHTKQKKEDEYLELFENLQDMENNKEQLYIDIYESKLYDIRNKSIIILVDYSLDKMYSRTISLITTINNFIKNDNNVTLLSNSTYPSNFIESLDDGCKFVNMETIKNIKFLNYELIITMSKKSMLHLIKKEYLYKTVIFEFNNCLETLQKLDNEYCLFVIKSSKIRNYYVSNNINPDKILVQKILIDNYDLNIEKRGTDKKLIYCGTLKESECIIDIIKEFKTLKKYRPTFSLTIVYGKIEGSKKFKETIKKLIKNTKEVTFKYNLKHKEACMEIAMSNIGLNFNLDVKESRKLKEYKKYNLDICYGKVTILCLLNNINDIDNLKNSIERQNYPFIKPVILLNKVYSEVIEFSNYYKIDKYDNESLGLMLNTSLNKIDNQSKFVSKFDSDDIYCENYLSEQIKSLIDNKCDVVGKTTQYWWFKNTDVLIKQNINNENKFVSSILGNSLTFKSEIINNHNIVFPDTNLLEVNHFVDMCIKDNLKVYSTSADNLFCVRENKNIWKPNYNILFHEKNTERVKDDDLYYKLFNYVCDKENIETNYVMNTDENKCISLANNNEIEFTSEPLKNDYMKILVSRDWKCSIPVGLSIRFDKCYTLEISNKTIINPLEYFVNPSFKIEKRSKNYVYKFSIIICFFLKTTKVFRLFIQSLDSLLKQSYTDYEIILVNDYINEKFDSDIYKIINDYDNITYLKNIFNYGVYISKNFGLSVSKGQIICFCDSDDYYNSERLEKYNKIYEDPDIYFTYESYKDYNGKIKYCPISLTFRRECLYDIGYFNDCRFSCDSEYMNKLFNYYSDIDFIKDELIITNLEENKYYKYGNKFSYVPEKLYIVNHGNIDRLTKNTTYGDKKRMQIYYNYIQLNKSHKLYKSHNMFYKPIYLHNQDNYVKDKATLICVTNKPKLIKYVVDKYNLFSYDKKELIICLHNIDIDDLYKNNDDYYYSEYQQYEKNDKNIRFISFNSNNKIGNMFNFAINISNGEYLFKIDDDDYYSKEWVSNSIDLHKQNENYCVVGKSSFYVYFSEAKEMRIYGWNYDEKETDWIGGFSISFHRSLTNYNNFKFLSKGEDSSFIKYSVKLGYVLYTQELNEDIIFIRNNKYNTLNDDTIYKNSKLVEDSEVLERLTNIVSNIEFLQD